MAEEPSEQAVVDREHLKLLEIVYYIAGGSKVLFALFPLIYVVIGVVFIGAGPRMPHGPDEPSPAIIGWFLAGIGLLVSGIIGGLGAAQIWVGRCIHKRSHRVACFVVAAIGCLNMPWGIAMGIFSFIVLGRASVGRLFEGGGLEQVRQAT